MKTQKSLVRLRSARWALQYPSARIKGADTRLPKIPSASAGALRQWWSVRRPRRSKNYGSSGGCRRCAGVRSKILLTPWLPSCHQNCRPNGRKGG